MARLILDISTSLDGFITGPAFGVEHPLGLDGGRLDDWMFDARTDLDADIRDQIYSTSGAVLMGPRMFRRRLRTVGRPTSIRDARVRRHPLPP
jgi:hypothetical protein